MNAIRLRSGNMLNPVNALRLLLLLGFCGVLTLVIQHYVGDLTIYAPEVADFRLTMHRAILENRPPPGETWGSMGANSVNARLATVWVTELASRLTGVGVLGIYKLIDMACLFAALVLLAIYLRRWFPGEYCVIGVAAVGCIAPLTMLLHSFHPWDRPSLLVALLAIWAIREDRMRSAAALLVLAVLIKFDAVLLPALYFLYRIGPDRWRRTTLITAGLFALTFGTYALLRVLVPGGFEERVIGAQVAKNLHVLADLSQPHPVVLGMALPVLLALAGFGRSDRFMRAGVILGLALFVPFFLTTNFNEIRAHMPILLLILPAALNGLRAVLKPVAFPAAAADGRTADAVAAMR